MSKIRTTDHTIEAISQYRCGVGDSIHYHPESKKIVHVDVESSGLYFLDTKQATYRKVSFPAPIYFVVPCKEDGKYIINQNSTICTYSTGPKQASSISEIGAIGEKEYRRLGKSRADPTGQALVFTTQPKETPTDLIDVDQGCLYLLKDGKLSLASKGFTLPSHISWSPDNQSMFMVDQYLRQVHVFDYDPNNCRLGKARLCFDTKGKDIFETGEMPCGIATDVENKIWLSYFNGGKLVRIDPVTGKLLTKNPILLPVTKPTSLCFGGEDVRFLYMTSSTRGLFKSDLLVQPMAGAVLKLAFERENIRGIVNNLYSGN